MQSIKNTELSLEGTPCFSWPVILSRQFLRIMGTLNLPTVSLMIVRLINAVKRLNRANGVINHYFYLI